MTIITKYALWLKNVLETIKQINVSTTRLQHLTNEEKHVNS